MKINLTSEIIEIVKSFEQTGKVYYKNDKTNGDFILTSTPAWCFNTNLYKAYVEPVNTFLTIYNKNGDTIDANILERDSMEIYSHDSEEEALKHLIENLGCNGKAFKLNEIIKDD